MSCLGESFTGPTWPQKLLVFFLGGVKGENRDTGCKASFDIDPPVRPVLLVSHL